MLCEINIVTRQLCIVWKISYIKRIINLRAHYFRFFFFNWVKILEPTMNATNITQSIFTQLMPNRLSAPRFRPRVGRAVGQGDECAYCRHPIEEILHAYLYQCMHHMHSICVIENMYQNGVDDDTGNLFCPQCHATSNQSV